MATIDGFNYLIGKPEEAVDLLGAEIGMSLAVYNATVIIVAGAPTAAAVVGIVGGVVWAGWGLYRALKGILSDYLPEGG